MHYTTYLLTSLKRPFLKAKCAPHFTSFSHAGAGFLAFICAVVVGRRWGWVVRHFDGHNGERRGLEIHTQVQKAEPRMQYEPQSFWARPIMHRSVVSVVLLLLLMQFSRLFSLETNQSKFAKTKSIILLNSTYKLYNCYLFEMSSFCLQQ